MCTVFFTPLWITTTVIRLLSLPVPNRFQNKTMVTLLISNIRSLSMIPIFVHIYIFFCTEPKNDNSNNTDICTAQNKSLDRLWWFFVCVRHLLCFMGLANLNDLVLMNRDIASHYLTSKFYVWCMIQ